MTNVHPIALDKSKPLHKETWFWPSVGAGAVFIIGAMVLFSKKDLGDPKQNEPTGSFTIEF